MPDFYVNNVIFLQLRKRINEFPGRKYLLHQITEHFNGLPICIRTLHHSPFFYRLALFYHHFSCYHYQFYFQITGRNIIPKL